MGLMGLMGPISLMSPIGPICIRGREVALPNAGSSRQRIEHEHEDVIGGAALQPYFEKVPLAGRVSMSNRSV